MPVSKTDVVDFVGLDESSGAVALSMFEERDWTERTVQLRQLEEKVNSYIGYVFGGQMNETAEFRGKPVEFELICQFIPPSEVAPVLRALKNHLEKQRIGFRVLIGRDGASRLPISI